MRPSQRRQWLQALSAAASLGNAEALALALDTLLEDGDVAANRPLSPGRVEKTLLPAGEILARPSVPERLLQELARSPYAAFRALAAAAWALRYLRGEPKAGTHLEALAKDERDEVRHALVRVLRKHGHQAPERVRALVDGWLAGRPASSPRIQAVALYLLPLLAEEEGVEAALDRLEKARLQNHPAVDEAWVQALADLGRKDGSAVLHRFGRWLLTRPRRAPRMAQALARPWAAHYPRQTLHLLEAMYHRWGRRRWITQALQALAREGALSKSVDDLLREWTET